MLCNPLFGGLIWRLLTSPGPSRKVRLRLAPGRTNGSCSYARLRPYSASRQSSEERRYLQGMLQFISTLLARFHREDEEGQTLVEYGLLLALIAIIVIVALLFLGPIVSQIFSNVAQNLQ